MGVVKVLVVDDSALIRILIPRLLGQDPDLSVVDTAADGEDALRRMREAGVALS